MVPAGTVKALTGIKKRRELTSKGGMFLWIGGWRHTIMWWAKRGCPDGDNPRGPQGRRGACGSRRRPGRAPSDPSRTLERRKHHADRTALHPIWPVPPTRASSSARPSRRFRNPDGLHGLPPRQRRGARLLEPGGDRQSSPRNTFRKAGVPARTKDRGRGRHRPRVAPRRRIPRRGGARRASRGQALTAARTDSRAVVRPPRRRLDSTGAGRAATSTPSTTHRTFFDEAALHAGHPEGRRPNSPQWFNTGLHCGLRHGRSVPGPSY